MSGLRRRVNAAGPLAIGASLAVAILALAAPGTPGGGAGKDPALALRAGGDARIVNDREGAAVIGRGGWVPGRLVRGHVRITNDGPGPTRVVLAVRSIRDSRVAADAGEAPLSAAAWIKVMRDRPVIDSRQTLYAGRLAGLEGVRAGEWREGDTRTFRLRARLRPAMAGLPPDDFERRRLSFTLQWRAAAAADGDEPGDRKTRGGG